MKVNTSWIYSPRFDLYAIIGPPVLITLAVLIWGNQLVQLGETPLWVWVLIVLGIDVAHVYSSLFRTYFDKDEFRQRRNLYLAVPLLVWMSGIVLYALAGAVWFWTVVAYMAIYHFVRQQYGFMMLYRRAEPGGDWRYRVDQAVIYSATLYPLLYWHTYSRNFDWFDQGQVFRLPSVWPEITYRYVYIGLLLLFIGKELYFAFAKQSFNLGKFLLVLATAASWSTGIILFNGDLTFSLVNIVSHGVPYMALIWVYQHRKRLSPVHQNNRFLNFFQLKYIPFYVAALLLLSYIENGFWDWFVWRDRMAMFGKVTIPLSSTLLIFVVPLLTMPQVTHYILDAYIWRVNKRGKEDVRQVLA
jgi:hypothetical protein